MLQLKQRSNNKIKIIKPRQYETVIAIRESKKKSAPTSTVTKWIKRRLHGI